MKTKGFVISVIIAALGEFVASGITFVGENMNFNWLSLIQIIPFAIVIYLLIRINSELNNSKEEIKILKKHVGQPIIDNMIEETLMKPINDLDISDEEKRKMIKKLGIDTQIKMMKDASKHMNINAFSEEKKKNPE
jgi:hypothetical protein